ncbi:hypothetical protein AAFC00_002455 [Neodothiora populina]|uniref:Uncharacterized protein n=1 Tax=Neodothiora populina TaxID=2781224 RepID=A0ABR3P7F5_9PEZI
MLQPQLRQVQGLRPILRSPSKCTPVAAASISPQIREYSWSWCHKQGDWLKPVDPEQDRLMRRRSINTKAKLTKKALQFQEQRKRSSNVRWSPFCVQSENCSETKSSTREGGKQRLEKLRRVVDATQSKEPYLAMFGKRISPFWDRPMPDYLKQEMAWQTPVSNETPSESNARTSAGRQSHSASASFRMQSSQRNGAGPEVSASYTSWDSATNQTRRAAYDPISGRMVDTTVEASPSSSDISSSGSYQKTSILSTLPKDDIDFLTASDVRASMGKTMKPIQQDLATRTQQLATLEEDYNHKTQNFDSEHEELVAARKSLEALRAQIQILERKAHSSTLIKPEDEDDSERLAFFESGWNDSPQGLQTAFMTEKEASEHGEKKSLEQEMNDLNTPAVQDIDDGYEPLPTGMQTQYEMENSNKGSTQTLEEELAALDRPSNPVVDDGYGTAPIGMQTLYEKEADGTLERELEKKEERLEVDDGYSTTPTGMQTAYGEEDSKFLELELGEKELRQEHDDGYSTAPTGMQNLYEMEDAGTLEQELNERLKRKAHDDGYSTNPIGMQTLYTQEIEGALAKELEDRSIEGEHDDGYSKKPIGLQTAFSEEKQQPAMTQPEEPPIDGGYATMPIGLQVLFRQEQIEAEANKRRSLEDELKLKPQMQAHEDGDSRARMGMQNSFEKEQELEGMRGEGDICSNVGKFCNTGRWYKQSASDNFSEDIQKAQQRTNDRALVQEIRGIYENQYGPITVEHEQSQHFASLQDNVVNIEEPTHDRTEPARPSEDNRPPQDLESTRTMIDDGTPLEEASTRLTKPPSSNIKWAEPAVYKVVAYDVHKEAISITTTPSNYANSDTPISISSALSRLYQPARFIPHFAELQKDGYQVINASRDWLVLRKVDRGDQDSSSEAESIINPVDPNITRRIPYEELPTGRFASPTGFVNHDPIFPPEPSQPAPGETVTVEIPVHGGPDVERYRHRRIRREEPVFSGSRRWKERRREQGYGRHGRRRFRDRITWALSVGAATAVCMYAVGVVGELAKK